MIEAPEQPKTEVLVELEALRAKVVEFHEKESDNASKGWEAQKEIEALEDEARKLGDREPELVDEFGVAVSKTNAVGKLQAARAKVEDPAVFYARRDHAAKIRVKAERDLEAFVAGHFDEIHAARVAEARRVRDQVTALREQHVAAAEAFLSFAKESVGLTAATSEFDGRDVRGIDEVSDLLRVLDRLEDLPLPTVGGFAEDIPRPGQPVFVERPKGDE